jgi:membrane AbrB-like protein
VAWLLIAAAILGVAFGLGALGLPSATLFAALLVGLVVSVTGLPRNRDPLRLPGWANRAGQAGIGVLIGALVQPSTMRSLAEHWLVMLAVIASTLLISLVAGAILGLHRDLDPITGTFALVAGGASGLTAISKDLGADQRVVAVVQYLRVLVIVLTMPAVASALPSGSAVAAPAPQAGAPLWGDLLFTACCLAAGLALARIPRIPAAALLGPMLIAAVLAATGLSHGATVPSLVQQVAYAAVGLQVGLSFTRESLRAVRRVLPAALGLVIALIVATAAIGIPLLRLAGASVLDAYLATTPGGLYAVLATAVSTKADVTLILTVQVLRLIVMLALAPVLATLLSRLQRRSPPADGDHDPVPSP